MTLQKRRTREVLVPLSHRPGHAQAYYAGRRRSSTASWYCISTFAWAFRTAMRRSSKPILAKLLRRFVIGMIKDQWSLLESEVWRRIA